ncbi:hypothetical protein ACSBR1_025214 [Camellia fascicularis]
MRDIKHLPEAVRSSVRSGIVLFNLTRVVEELIFNSLDARATKVSVAVGVGTHYIKVVDNGCGITRDGLVLLGEDTVTEYLSSSEKLSFWLLRFLTRCKQVDPYKLVGCMPNYTCQTFVPYPYPCVECPALVFCTFRIVHVT